MMRRYPSQLVAQQARAMPVAVNAQRVATASDAEAISITFGDTGPDSLSDQLDVLGKRLDKIEQQQ